MNREEKIQKIENLVYILNEATNDYEDGHPAFSDKEWDDMYFELLKLEKETGYVSIDSPTHSIYYKSVNELKKVKHNHFMLSLNKTKNIDEVESFVKNKDFIAMAKMDGLTCSLKYEKGRLVSAETRGDGIIGEDILHNAKVIPSIPNIIDFQDTLIIDGEIICTYKDFEKFSDTYKNPRNFASGSIRLLDSKECYNRNLTFVAWDVVKGGKYNFLSQNLVFLSNQGFLIVPFVIDDEMKISKILEILTSYSESLNYPIDGIVFKYDNIKEYNKMGHTDHHFKGGLAYKFYDETYSTQLRYISWSMGRTGVLTPVAVFDPVIIDGTEITRANLHNISVMKDTLGDCAYVGEPLEIAKVNQIIPQIISAGPKYDYGYVISHGGVSANDAPEHCPICNGEISYRIENNIERAYCDNLNCKGKLINRLDHFCGKKGLDIKGLSKATLEKLIDWDWINNISDIFTLKNYRDEWIKKQGFGITSVDKILKAIEESKNCSTNKFICSLGIPLIGKTASITLAQTFKTYLNFREAFNKDDSIIYEIDGIGEVMIENIKNFDYNEADTIYSNYINEITDSVPTIDTILSGKIFVITGKITQYKNREELKSFIESKGGKVVNSVTSKTSYLINNDITSNTIKNLTAKRLNIPIITEEDFINLIS